MLRKDYKTLPEAPGVYLMKGVEGKILYVGKAGNLRRRVSSYFDRPHDVRIETLVGKIHTIDHHDTDSALEALILEAALIKKLRPPFNIREKDDKAFLYVAITKDKFPRVTLVRGTGNLRDEKSFGPFVSASQARTGMKILRKIFPWNTHPPEMVGAYEKPCFDAQVGLCPGTCVGAIGQKEYRKTVDRLALFFEGKKRLVIRSLENEMADASKKLEFEKAAKLRHQLFALKHIQDTALISDAEISARGIENAKLETLSFRIEGYDISNISGTSAVGSMVVFENGVPNKNEYRRFKIKTVVLPNDVAMLVEVLERRFNNDWPHPNLILIDGGLPQANAARKTLARLRLRIPIVGLAKGPERKRNDVIGAIPKGATLETLIRVRDEAHRFAISYHKLLRKQKMFQ